MPTRAPGILVGLKVLVVEDSYLIAEHVCTILDREGCEVLGPAGRLASGLALAEGEPPPDCAVLDINLNGELCFPIARALAIRCVPVVFLTGYDDQAIIPPDLMPAAVLNKPLAEAALVDVVSSACASRPR
jgi:DNA-binding response OmpR family regulator